MSSGVRRIADLPASFSAFRREIAESLGAVYGGPAARYYESHAELGLRATLAVPGAYAWLAETNGREAGLLIATARKGNAQILLCHVLREALGQGVEDALLSAAVAALRTPETRHLLYGCQPTAPLQIDAAMRELEFVRVPRHIMSAPLREAVPPGAIPRSRSIQPEQFPAAAKLLADAYRNEPGRMLHQEVTDATQALDLIARLAQGLFGEAPPEFLRASFDGGVCTGVVLGCLLPPETGFVMQLAVDPGARGRGLGAALLAELAAAFRAAGLQQIALTVTKGNPANRIYQRAGLKTRLPFDCYYWQPAADPA